MADLVRGDLVLVLLACGAELERAALVVLDACLDFHPGAGGPDQGLWFGDGVQQDRVGGVEDAGCCFCPAHPFVGLGCEHERRSVGADDLDEPCDAFAACDR